MPHRPILEWRVQQILAVPQWRNQLTVNADAGHEPSESVGCIIELWELWFVATFNQQSNLPIGVAESERRFAIYYCSTR
jgi:hypothetical protein